MIIIMYDYRICASLKPSISELANKHQKFIHFFTERVVSRWNSLPQEAVCAPSINAFKGHLTRIRNMKMGFFKIAEPQSQSRLNRIGQPGK